MSALKNRRRGRWTYPPRGIRLSLECLEPRTLLSLVAGTVFNDLDGDGARDFVPGGSGTPLWTEPGIPGRVVFAEALFSDPPDVISTSTSDDGSYRFDFQGPGYLTIRHDMPGWRQTMPSVAIEPVVPRTTRDPGNYIVTVSDSGEDILGKDFGVQGPGRGRIHGTLWWDLDRDGARDAGEPGLAGRTVFLDLDQNGRRDFPEPAQATGDDGSYSFLALAAGTYNVVLQGRAGWERTYPRVSAPDNRRLVAMDALGAFYTIDPATGDSNPLFTPSIPDYSWGLAVAPDGNFLTIQRPFELGPDPFNAEPVRIYSVRPSDGAVTSSVTLVTFDFGDWKITNYSYPHYNLEIDPRTGLLYAPYSRLAGNMLRFDAMNGFIQPAPAYFGTGSVFVGMASDASGKLYGLRPEGHGGGLFTSDPEAGGTLYVTPLDRSFRDAVMEFDPLTGLLNVVGRVREGGGPDSWNLYTLNPETGRTTLIGPTGLEELTGLRFMPPQGFNLGAQTVTVSDAHLAPEANFGNYVAPVEIAGAVWEDSNANGTRENAEPGMAGWLVNIEASSNALPGFDRRFTSTDAAGHFVFPPLESGTYTIAESPQADWRQTSPGFPGQTLDMLELGTYGLYRMNHLTGDLQRVANKVLSDQSPVGIALAADGSIYTLTHPATGPLDPPDYSVFTLYAWNSFSQRFDPVGTTGTTGVIFTDLAVNPATGTLYAVGAEMEQYGALFTLDPSTGRATLVGQFAHDTPDPVPLGFMAFDKAGVLYLLDGGTESRRVRVIDPQTAANPRTFRLSQRPPEIVAMDIDPTSGALYILGEDGRGPGEIYTVSLTTGEVTLIGSTIDRVGAAGARFRLGRQGTHTIRLSAGGRTENVDFGNARTNRVVQLPGGRGANSAVVSLNSHNYVEVWNNKKRLFSQPLGSFPGLTILGAANKSDTLTVNLSAGGPFAIPDGIVFDGGLGTNADTLVLRGTSGPDTLGSGTNSAALGPLVIQFTEVEQLTLDGGAGNDAYQIAVLSTKTTISDNKGLDSLYFSGSAAAGVTIDLSKSASQAQRVFAAGANRLGLKGTLENVIGTPQADWIKGNALANRIEGGDGNDTLYGGPGNDTLYGGPGNDWLYGEAGKDTLFGESGNNVLVGGAGNDTLNVLASADAAGRNLLIGGLGIDALQGGPGEEILVGGTTKYDNKVAALAAIMQEWALPATTFAERRQHLDAGFMEDNAGWIQLKVKNRENPRGSVLDDRTTDLLLGGLGSNWLLVFSKDETPTP